MKVFDNIFFPQEKISATEPTHLTPIQLENAPLKEKEPITGNEDQPFQNGKYSSIKFYINAVYRLEFRKGLCSGCIPWTQFNSL